MAGGWQAIAEMMARFTAPSPDRPFALIEAEGETTPAWLADELVIDTFKRYGAVLLRGFSADLDAFHAFTQRFCVGSVFNDSPNRALLDPSNNIQSVDRGDRAFPLHPELSREPWKPDVCFFHCLQPPAQGGETTICDGIEIVRQLPPDVRAGFARHRLLYLQPMPPWHLHFWFGTEQPSPESIASPPAACPYFFVTIGGHLVRAFTRPALHKPMFADEPAFGNFLLFARYQNGKDDFPVLDNGHLVPAEWVEAVKAVSDRLTIALRWQVGDLLMLDNSRFMHGRNAIEDPSTRTIASYFGYLSFAPPNPEEPGDPIWRRGTFRPPQAMAPVPTP